jgi:tRNA A-37 threonylcarbamoyl transferase component Bud32
MAEVFEAELVGDLGFVRKVAIKRMLASAVADPSAARRFLDEARIASRLHHANVVAVVDLGLLDDLPFQVLEYVDGIDAQQLLARAGGALPLEIALVIAGGVAHALDHAHTAVDGEGLPLGIVHRDVKPSNVIVSWAGDIKLGDFGIAVARDRTALTETGVVGTHGFLAPEQRTRAPVDGRTDVFALGLTLYALITGQTPFADIEVEARVLAGEPVPLDPELPVDVRALLAHALAPARGDRPSAGAFAEAIGSALAPRIVRDARTLLLGFLAQHAPSRPSARPGALDQLLGIEVVAVDGGAGEVRRFATVHADAEPATVPSRPPPPPRRRWPYLVIPVLLAGAGGIAYVAWPARPSAPTPRDAGSPVAVAPALADAAPVPADAQAVIAEVPADAPPVKHASRKPPPKAEAPAPPPASGTGYLVVTGEELIGAAVTVDGAVAGYAPNLIEVALGHHRVDVVRRDGTHLGAKDVEVTTFHTRNRPAHPSW